MRYSMRRLLVGMTLASIYAAIAFAAPPRLALLLLGLLSFVMPAIYASGVIYSRHGWRAFWIGTAACGVIPALWADWLMADVFFTLQTEFFTKILDVTDDSRASEARLTLVFAQVLPLLGGMTGVVMRLAFQPHQPESSGASTDHE